MAWIMAGQTVGLTEIDLVDYLAHEMVALKVAQKVGEWVGVLAVILADWLVGWKDACLVDLKGRLWGSSMGGTQAEPWVESTVAR